MNYREQMAKAMSLLSDNGYLFIGQSVVFPGTAMFGTLKDVPMSQRLEFPVAENFQLGFSTGLSLQGINVCSLFPRMDFLLSAYDQLINHLDKISLLSQDRFTPKVIIRTSVGGTKNLNPGLQHVGNYIDSLRMMLETVQVISLDSAKWVYQAYEYALNSERSSILVEFGDLYD